MSNPPAPDDEQALGLTVECYAGYRGDETPIRFHIGRRGVEVLDVLDRWLGPERRYFKVRGDDGGIYILSHHAVTERWDLTLFDAGRNPDTRLSST
jgi:hypothetical protein